MCNVKPLLLVLCLYYVFNISYCFSDNTRAYMGAVVMFNYTQYGMEHVLGSDSSSSEVGIYGSDSPKKSASGIIVLGGMNDSDLDGCNYDYPELDTNVPWIALIARGSCNFSIKIGNAQDRNASGVIIYDYEDEQQPPTMSHQDSNEIVAISIKYNLGKEVANKVKNGITVFVSISPGTTHNDGPPGFHLETTSIIFVAVSFMILMLVSLAWLIFYYIQRFRIIQNHNRGQRRRVDMAVKALAKIQTRTLKQRDSLLSVETICAICLECYKVGDNIRCLPCKHSFHKKCVDPWLHNKHTCPMCKINVIKALGVLEHDNPNLTTDDNANEVESNVSIELVATNSNVDMEDVDAQHDDGEPHFSGSTNPSSNEHATFELKV